MMSNEKPSLSACICASVCLSACLRRPVKAACYIANNYSISSKRGTSSSLRPNWKLMFEGLCLFYIQAFIYTHIHRPTYIYVYRLWITIRRLQTYFYIWRNIIDATLLHSLLRYKQYFAITIPIMFASAYVEVHEFARLLYEYLRTCILISKHTRALHEGIIMSERETQCVLFLLICCEKVNHISRNHQRR